MALEDKSLAKGLRGPLAGLWRLLFAREETRREREHNSYELERESRRDRSAAYHADRLPGQSEYGDYDPGGRRIWFRKAQEASLWVIVPQEARPVGAPWDERPGPGATGELNP